MSACTPEIDSRSVGERAIGDLLPLSRLVKLRQEQTAVRPPALRRPVTRPAALAAGLEGRVRFVVGDAERLPLADSSVDAVMCECALCTFPDKAAAARELARVLSPGGKLALSDMTADSDRLPQALRSLDGWIACISDARPLEEIAALLVEAELEVIVSERHDEALHAMVDRAEGRLRLARALGAGGPPELTGSIERALTIVSAARNAIADRALGYGTLVARKSGAW